MTDTLADSFTDHELRFERLLDADVDTVWRYITDPELRARWFMGGPTDLRVGGAMGMTMAHDNLSDDDVPMPEKYAKYDGNAWSETITRLDPPHLIAFGWDGGENGDVTIELSPAGNRTRLVLTHRNIPERSGAINFGGGWHSHLAVLEKRLRGEPVANFWALHAQAEATVREVLG